MSRKIVNHPTVVRSHKGKPSVRVSIHVGFLGSFVLRSDGLTTLPFINLPLLRMLLQNTGACYSLHPSRQYYYNHINWLILAFKETSNLFKYVLSLHNQTYYNR